jgi:hypothetical protein
MLERLQILNSHLINRTHVHLLEFFSSRGDDISIYRFYMNGCASPGAALLHVFEVQPMQI